MKRIDIRPHPKCKNCLGKGKAMLLFTPQEVVCNCITEQLRVILQPEDKRYDHDLPGEERYSPGQAEYVIDMGEAQP